MNSVTLLIERQGAIEKKLAARRVYERALALYDLSSSYFGGRCCPLAKNGYSRDGRRHTPQVNYGLLTMRTGCPVAISTCTRATRRMRTRCCYRYASCARASGSSGCCSSGIGA